MDKTLSGSMRNGRLYWPVICISDLHLGKKYSQADMLFEFLQHVDCDYFILNGDIIDGWALESKKQKSLPEMHQRVLDAINARIAGGSKVVYIPGNHDEKLRKEYLYGSKILGIEIQEALNYQDRKGKHWFFLHGDQFDPVFLKKKAPVLYHLGDVVYNGLVAANVTMSKVVDQTLSERFSAAAEIKQLTKKTLKRIGKFNKAVQQSAIDNNVDGVICGHLHFPETQRIRMQDSNGKERSVYYCNSGDWVETCSALVQTDRGIWGNVDWPLLRQELGLSERPKESDPNPFQAFRSITQKQVSLVNKFWPGKDRKERIAEIREIRREIIDISDSPAEVLSSKHAQRLDKLKEKEQKLSLKLGEPQIL